MKVHQKAVQLAMPTGHLWVESSVETTAPHWDDGKVACLAD